MKSLPLLHTPLAFFNDGKAKRKLRSFANRWNRARMADRSRKSKYLVLVGAGHKPDLWPLVLPRLKKFCPADYDVCVVSPGVSNRKLAQICEQNGWSYVETRANKLAVAQNFAIARHPSAEWIFKLDEDIVVGEGFFEGLLQCHAETESEKRFRTGFVAPLLNVNGFSYRILLEMLECRAEYESLFGPALQACRECAAHLETEAAIYLWKITQPFDELAARFRALPHATSICPHRFSIGAILLTRALWEEMEGFTIAAPGSLGVDESDICAYCVDQSRVMVVSHNVLAGHVGFRAQTDAVLREISGRPDLYL